MLYWYRMLSICQPKSMMQDVPTHLRNGLNDENPEKTDNIKHTTSGHNTSTSWPSHYSVLARHGRQCSLQKIGWMFMHEKG
jgi:hypothetical protein